MEVVFWIREVSNTVANARTGVRAEQDCEATAGYCPVLSF